MKVIEPDSGAMLDRWVAFSAVDLGATLAQATAENMDRDHVLQVRRRRDPNLGDHWEVICITNYHLMGDRELALFLPLSP